MSRVFDMNTQASYSLRPRQALLLNAVAAQRGASLIMVMVILTIVSMLGIAGIQVAMMSERGARNERDLQIAWQSAEAALLDAELDIYGPSTSARQSLFKPTTNLLAFVDSCGTTGNSQGLCSLAISGKPAWLAVDFTLTTGSSVATTAFGDFTGRSFSYGTTGIQPSKKPRYVVEPIRDQGYRDLGDPEPHYVYRVTAMGFGPRDDIQAVMQMIYRD